jgi:Cofilin/tropomyosin-type actin-binding protein
MSFMDIADDARDAFHDVSRGRVRAVLLKITSDSQCELAAVHQKADNAEHNFEGEWNAFLESGLLPDDECRYLIYDFAYMSAQDRVERSKTLFITWAPADADKKIKMLTAFCANAMVSQLTGGGGGISARLQAGSIAGLDFQETHEKALRHSTVK